MFCPHCNSFIAESNATVCPFCGKALPKQQPIPAAQPALNVPPTQNSQPTPAIQSIQFSKNTHSNDKSVQNSDKKGLHFSLKKFLILTFIFFLPFFIWGILDPICYPSNSWNRNTWGIMRLSDGFLCSFLWALIGVTATALAYFITEFIRIYFTSRIETAQMKAFRFYTVLPTVLAVLIFAACFIWGAIDPCLFQISNWYNASISYGILQMPNAFLCWFVWVLIGAGAAAATFIITTITFSYRILHIAYLQQLLGDKIDTKNLIFKK